MRLLIIRWTQVSFLSSTFASLLLSTSLPRSTSFPLASCKLFKMTSLRWKIQSLLELMHCLLEHLLRWSYCATRPVLKATSTRNCGAQNLARGVMVQFRTITMPNKQLIIDVEKSSTVALWPNKTLQREEEQRVAIQPKLIILILPLSSLLLKSSILIQKLPLQSAKDFMLIDRCRLIKMDK